MIKHIVFWRLHPEAEGKTREENALRIKTALEALAGKIPGLLHIEVGIDFSNSDQSSHVALYSEFESREALDVYQAHPLHQAVLPLVGALREDRRVVDYEV